MGRAPRHHAGSCRQLCLQLVLQQWELWERGEGGVGRRVMAPTALPEAQCLHWGWPLKIHGSLQLRLYTRSQELTHCSSPSGSPAGEVTPAGKEVWWAWSHHSFQGPAPACQVTEAPCQNWAWKQAWGMRGIQGSLGYLPEVLTVVADTASTACPPGKPRSPTSQGSARSPQRGRGRTCGQPAPVAQRVRSKRRGRRSQKRL